MRVLLMLLFFGLAVMPAFAGEEEKQASKTFYKLKDEEPNPRNKALRGYSNDILPLDKTYDQLSATDRAKLHAKYEGMGPDDEPPFPLRGMRQLRRGVHEASTLAGVAGVLDVRVVVGPDGNAQTVNIYETPDDNLARAVAYLLVQEKYKPAKCGGSPCAQEFQIRTEIQIGW